MTAFPFPTKDAKLEPIAPGDKTFSPEFADEVYNSGLPPDKQKKIFDDILNGRDTESGARTKYNIQKVAPKSSFEFKNTNDQGIMDVSGGGYTMSESGILPASETPKPPMAAAAKPNIVKERLLPPKLPKVDIPKPGPAYMEQRVPNPAPEVQEFQLRSLKDIMAQRDAAKVNAAKFLDRPEDLSAARDNTLANSLISSSIQSGLAGVGKIAKTDLSGQSNALNSMNEQAKKAEADQMGQRQIQDARFMEAQKLMPDQVKNELDDQKYQQDQITGEQNRIKLQDLGESMRDKVQSRDPNSAVSKSMREALVNTLGIDPKVVEGKSSYELSQIQGLWSDKAKNDAVAKNAANALQARRDELEYTTKNNSIERQKDRDASAENIQLRGDLAAAKTGAGKVRPLGQEVVTDFANMKNMLNEFNQIKELKKKVNTGPVSEFGRDVVDSKVGQLFGLTNSPESTQLRIKVGKQLAEYIKGISGATVSEPERAKLTALLPKEGDDDAKFDSALEATRQGIINHMNMKLQSFKDAGYDTGTLRGAQSGAPDGNSDGWGKSEMKAGRLP